MVWRHRPCGVASGSRYCWAALAIPSITDFKTVVNEAVGRGIKVSLGEGWTRDATAAKPKRMGAGFAHLVPSWDRGNIPGAPLIVPDWYNR